MSPDSTNSCNQIYDDTSDEEKSREILGGLQVGFEEYSTNGSQRGPSNGSKNEVKWMERTKCEDGGLEEGRVKRRAPPVPIIKDVPRVVAAPSTTANWSMGATFLPKARHSEVSCDDSECGEGRSVELFAGGSRALSLVKKKKKVEISPRLNMTPKAVQGNGGNSYEYNPNRAQAQIQLEVQKWEEVLKKRKEEYEVIRTQVQETQV